MADWQLIGKKSPQLPQMFYPVERKMTLTRGDTVAARCTMVNNRDRYVITLHRNLYTLQLFRTTYIGTTNEDEMCNFYIMYWTNKEVLTQKSCFSLGPPC